MGHQRPMISTTVQRSKWPEDAIEFYSEVAPAFHLSYQSAANRLERIRVWRDFLDRYVAGAAFGYDVGCGSGVLTCEMAKRGIETIGIDGSAAMLAIADKTAREHSLSNVRFLQERLPITNSARFRQADIVICSSIIEYLDSIPDSLRFLRNLLKDSGIIIFSVPNRESFSRKIARRVHRWTGRPRYLKFSRHFMNRREIQAALSRARLTYIDHAYFDHSDYFNRFLGLFLPPNLSSNMIIVVARRELYEVTRVPGPTEKRIGSVQ